MKKITRLLFVLLILAGCDGGEDITPDQDQDDGYRLDKILNFSTSTASDPYGVVELQYNSENNLEKKSFFDEPEHILTTYMIYEYSGDKLVKKSIFDGQVGNLTLGTYIIYEYEGDKVARELLFRGDGSSVHTTHYRFWKDNLLETYKVSDDLGTHHHYIYTYDVLEELLREDVFMYDEVMENFTSYSYDLSGRLARTELFDHTSTLTSIVEKKYNGTDELPFEEWYLDANGTLLSKHVFIYDNNKNVIEEDIVVGGVSNALFRKKFEGKRIVEEIFYAPTFGFEEWTVARYEYSKK